MRLLSLDVARFTVRSIPTSARVGLVLAAAPAGLTVLFGGSDLTGAVGAAGLVGGAMMGFAIDDPAMVTLAASPTPLLRRRLVRLAALLVFAAALGIAMAVLVAVAHEGTSISLVARLREGMVAAGVSAAGAAWLTRRGGEPRPGSFGVIVGLLAPLLVSALAFRVDGLPSLNAVAYAGRWWWVTVAAAATAVWWSRDLARR